MLSVAEFQQPANGDGGFATIYSGNTDYCRFDSECIPVTGGHRYLAGASGRAKFCVLYTSVCYPNGFGSGLSLVWSRDAGCGDPIGLEPTFSFRNSDYRPFWQWVRPESLVVFAPADAKSVYVQANIPPTSYPYHGAVGIDDIVLALVTSASTTTTTLGCSGYCGNPVSGVSAGTATTSDALYILRVAVGQGTCEPCVCDVNDSGGISASDALLTLAASVGGPVSLTCPP